jgi:dolichyl-phosphate beta-glucosyltransferase
LAQKVKSTSGTSSSSPQKASDVEIAVFGSRAHLEKQALATVNLLTGLHYPHLHDVSFLDAIFSTYVFAFFFSDLLQRKWYRNFLMKGFHLVVLLTAGPGIRDTQVCFFNLGPLINECS